MSCCWAVFPVAFECEFDADQRLQLGASHRCLNSDDGVVEESVAVADQVFDAFGPRHGSTGSLFVVVLDLVERTEERVNPADACVVRSLLTGSSDAAVSSWTITGGVGRPNPTTSR